MAYGGYPFLRHALAFVNPDGTRELVFKGGSTYLFDSDGWLIKETDRNGNRVDITRDASGDITGIADNFGRSLDITPVVINGTTVIGSIKDSLDNEVVYDYDLNRQLTSVTYPGNGRTVYAYENGIIHSVTQYEDYTDPNDPGITEVVNTYDSYMAPPYKRVLKQTYPDGGELYIDYDIVTWCEYFCAGKTNCTCTGGPDSVKSVDITVADPLGNGEAYHFNGSGYLTSYSTYSGTTTYGRVGTNNITSVTDSLSRTTAYTYESGLVNSVTDPAGNTTYYFYENPDVNKPTRIEDALGNVTTLSYDSNGNPTSFLPPGASNPATMTYNQWGLLNTAANALGNTVSFDYYPFGMIANVTGPSGDTASFEYDAIGRVRKATDPKGRSTSYDYYNGGRIANITDPLGGVTTVTVDSRGKLLSVRDAKSQTVSYAYDNKGSVETMTDQTRTAAESLEHDLNDNVTSVTDRKGQTTSVPAGGYDAMDRLTRVDFHDGGYTTFAYDAAGRIVNSVDSLSGQLDFTYTAHSQGDRFPDRVKRATAPQGAINYTYDELGRRTSMTVEGRPAVNYTYTQAGVLNSVSTTNPVTSAPMEFVFAYDELGRRTGMTYPNGVTAAYGYDAAGRVEDIVYKDASGAVLESLAYAYDANGNVTSMDRPGVEPLLPGVTDAAYNNPLNRMDTFNGETLAYDANGNLTRKGDTIYTWDARDRLVGIANTPGGDASFAYDAFGRRVEKTVGGVKTKYLYDGLDIVEEFDGLGNVKAYYIRTLNIDEPLARIAAGGAVRYYHADALGSIIALTDESGNVTARYNYSPFGQTEIVLDTDGSGAANPFRYTGREHDETGLYYYRARYYSPEMGRFISEDPIRFAGGINFYSYVGNSPVNWIDPLGLILQYANSNAEGLLKPSVQTLMKSPAGRQLLRRLHNSKTLYLINALAAGTNNAYQLGNNVYIDPTFHPIIQTNIGQLPASTSRILAHELGHLTGMKDDGPYRMNNVNAYENPIMQPLENCARTRY